MIKSQSFGKYDPFHIRYGSGSNVVDVTKLRCKVSSDVLDAAAQKILTGGYTNKRNPICTSCYVRKSNSGSCNC